ncbi:Retrovirus-related Pol polyprotein from transposon RE1 [Vitis vinifera]|uniref:Retrovirus-related Pol polyprotein from transposon RE1 n=1 Tax=Vitis vinifera TaxID=29760 RepID=A0A438JUK3_VITVI|nr:Retrovirus-related Pol polyprotein from transposon RE1 [Vitis vinifera]
MVSSNLREHGSIDLQRPDIAFAVSVVSQYMHSLKESHLEAVYKILRYLKGSPGRGLFFKKGDSKKVEIYTDADWTGSARDKWSTTDYCTYVWGNLVTWKSKKQSVVARNSVEAEFKAVAQDYEIEDLEGLMRSLDELHLSPLVPDARFWPLSSSGLFSVKSFFLALSQFSESSQNFPSKFVWNSQVPFKVKSFVWLFQLAKMDWVPPRSIFDMMSIKFNGFGISKWGLVLWQAASIALIRVVWWERNARIFEDKVRNSEFLWDSIVFLASLWAFCFKAFKGTPLNVLQLD